MMRIPEKRKIIICFLLFYSAVSVYGQSVSDSIITKYKSYEKQKEKEEFLLDYLNNVLYLDNKALKKLVELSNEFKKQNDEIATDLTNLLVAIKLSEAGNYTNGLDIAFPILSKFEKREDSLGIVYSYMSISYCYNYSQNKDEAIRYLKKSIPLAMSIGDEKLISHIYNDMGAIYAYASKPDSGLMYAQKSVALSTKINYEVDLPFGLSTVAENYMGNNDYDLAVPFLRRAASYARKSQNEVVNAFIDNDFGQAFLGLKQYDSAYYHIQQAIKYYDREANPLGLLRSYQYLSQYFEETNKPDSANKYFRLAVVAKDSIFSMDKARLIQSMSYAEQLRQQDIENEKIKSEQDRKYNIQYALIALGIIIFIIIFLLLSRSIITNTKIIEYLGVFALLAAFEFLNLLLHPLLENITDHSPFMMLSALVCIAALLIPLHHKLEKWTIYKLVEKNKAIRLANAKKTIEKLEERKVID